MRFGAYLEKLGVQQTAAAIELGCSKTYVSRLVAGLAEPSLSFARKIRDWSGGDVAVDDWPPPIVKSAA